MGIASVRTNRTVEPAAGYLKKSRNSTGAEAHSSSKAQSRVNTTKDGFRKIKNEIKTMLKIPTGLETEQSRNDDLPSEENMAPEALLSRASIPEEELTVD